MGGRLGVTTPDARDSGVASGSWRCDLVHPKHPGRPRRSAPWPPGCQRSDSRGP